MSRPKIIGIVGASGSGKTTLARDLAARAGKSCMVSQDNYYISLPDTADAAGWNFDDPAGIDLEHLARDLAALKTGRVVEGPRYIFSTHLRAPDPIRLNPAPVIVVEGLFLFLPEILRDVFDLKLFIDVPLETCLERRLARDVAERGRKEEMIRQRWREQVEPMFLKHVVPTRRFADIVLKPAPLGSAAYKKQLAAVWKNLSSNDTNAAGN